MAQAYYSPISINAAQVPSTQTDFPVLVSLTDARFKTIANGGHVADAQGDDIRPYTDTTLGTAITGYQKVFYDGINGILEMWVKVASLTSSSTPFVLGYGDASLTTDGSSTTTWSNSFLAVYHLADGSTLNLFNSAPTVLTLTNSNVTAAAGQIDGGAAFNGTTAFLRNDGSAPTLPITVSAWVKRASTSNSGLLCGWIDQAQVNWFAFYLFASSTTLDAATGNNSTFGISNKASNDTNWHLVHGVFNSTTNRQVFIDGVAGTANTTSITSPSPARIVIGASTRSGTTDNFFPGTEDEVRYSTVARSQDWITTEFNNQSAPATFMTLGTEVPIASTNTSAFFLLFP